MLSGLEPSAATRRTRGLMCLGCALLPPLFSFVDLGIAGHFVINAMMLRLAWSLGLILAGRVLLRGSARAYPWAWRLAGVGSVLAYCAIVGLLGASAVHLYGWIFAMPLAVALLALDDPLTAALASVAAVFGSVAIELRWGTSPTQLVIHGLLVGFSGGLAVAASSIHRRHLVSERSALERLAESERRRAAAERLATVGGLAAGVAHEINNPLGYVKSNLATLREEAAGPRSLGDGELNEIWAETHEGLERIRRIVADLRTFAGDEGDRSDETCFAGNAVEQAVQLAGDRLRGKVTVTTEVSPGLPPVKISTEKLTQALLNLLLNVGDALADKLPAEGGRVRLWAASEGRMLRLVCEDNGPGIPEKVLSRIFEPFLTTKAPGKGTGMGLAMAHEFVRRSGGSVTAENRVEGGARFILRVPFAP